MQLLPCPVPDSELGTTQALGGEAPSTSASLPTGKIVVSKCELFLSLCYILVILVLVSYGGIPLRCLSCPLVSYFSSPLASHSLLLDITSIGKKLREHGNVCL